LNRGWRLAGAGDRPSQCRGWGGGGEAGFGLMGAACRFSVGPRACVHMRWCGVLCTRVCVCVCGCVACAGGGTYVGGVCCGSQSASVLCATVSSKCKCIVGQQRLGVGSSVAACANTGSLRETEWRRDRKARIEFSHICVYAESPFIIVYV